MKATWIKGGFIVFMGSQGFLYYNGEGMTQPTTVVRKQGDREDAAQIGTFPIFPFILSIPPKE